MSSQDHKHDPDEPKSIFRQIEERMNIDAKLFRFIIALAVFGTVVTLLVMLYVIPQFLLP
ncbi:hypothetical protein B0H94_11219 [Salsuginibacillus halophilus]|uniref:Uncharacterized protein n=1 Tax=Salsuginibacillus halophilus TaxID=517424 RepID=A0A2P8H9M6_9BACI|nr:hypothetical protein [Salsuginibacillus halophilus]PSL42936.1 hypothetical protein B0H94_11219 [Salsuginibacillus halophilus]